MRAGTVGRLRLSVFGREDKGIRPRGEESGVPSFEVAPELAVGSDSGVELALENSGLV